MRVRKVLPVLLAAALCAAPLAGCGRGNYVNPAQLFEETEGLEFKGNSVKFTEKKMTRTFVNGETEEGFYISYRVEGNNPEYTWVDTGGLYIELVGETVDVDEVLEPLYFNFVIFQDPPSYGDPMAATNACACIWITENGTYTHGGTEEGATYLTDMAFAISRYPMDVELAYYNGAIYVRLDRTWKGMLTADTVFGSSEFAPDLYKLFQSGTKKLGFRSANTPATFSKIQFQVGDAAAKRAASGMGFNPQ